MREYHKSLNSFAYELRKAPTLPESILWSRIKQGQILNVLFYKQEVIENFIVDFYAPSIKLVIEVDGAQHFQQRGLLQDRRRDARLRFLGLWVLRYNNREILRSLENVLEDIWNKVEHYKQG